MTKFIVDNRTDAYKTDVNLFFTIKNCQIVCSRSGSLTYRIDYNFMYLSSYWQWQLVNERGNFCSYLKIMIIIKLLLDSFYWLTSRTSSFPPIARLRSFSEYGKSVIGNLKLSCVTLTKLVISNQPSHYMHLYWINLEKLLKYQSYYQCYFVIVEIESTNGYYKCTVTNKFKRWYFAVTSTARTMFWYAFLGVLKPFSILSQTNVIIS